MYEAPATIRNVIVRYIVDQGTISPRTDANWSFVPLPGTTVLFDTGPMAADYINDVKGVDIALRVTDRTVLPSSVSRSETDSSGAMSQHLTDVLQLQGAGPNDILRHSGALTKLDKALPLRRRMSSLASAKGAAEKDY